MDRPWRVVHDARVTTPLVARVGRTPRSFLAKRELLSNGGPCVHVGVDENGLGPMLGPLIVTGVSFRVTGARPTSLGQLVGDSKALVSHADVSLGEAWARALLTTLGDPPRTPSEVLARISLDDEATLRAPCPRDDGDVPAGLHAASMCWPPERESFFADDALVERCLAIVRGWSGERRPGRFARRDKVELAGVRAAILCPSRLNDAASRGRHKFLVDLHEMERLALRLHEEADPKVPLDAVCGKVGGMDYYGDYFGPLSSRLYAIEAEGDGTSAYRFPGLGRVTFVRDADAIDPLVGLASLVGKYLRELLMARVVRYMRTSALPEHLGPNEIQDASGYHDPNTKRFIAATELVRAHRGVPDRCFRRTS